MHDLHPTQGLLLILIYAY